MSTQRLPRGQFELSKASALSATQKAKAPDPLSYLPRLYTLGVIILVVMTITMGLHAAVLFDVSDATSNVDTLAKEARSTHAMEAAAEMARVVTEFAQRVNGTDVADKVNTVLDDASEDVVQFTATFRRLLDAFAASKRRE